MSADLLTATDVHLAFGPTRALDGVSVAVRPGEVLALVGPSGSGKSTLLHCLAGVLRPDRGTVVYAGRRIDDAGDEVRSRVRRERFGFVFQFGSLVPELTAVENVAFPLRLSGVRRRPAEARARAWLDRLGVGEVAAKRPGEMSGGQGQRVAVARALVGKPTVVFADEPTGALDSFNGELVMGELMTAVREEGAAVVLVTHEERIAAYADREIELRDGRLAGVPV
ncbi:ABC transporter ATP-binding protein [Phytohabitans houttuyneae]|jgi:putative ABC transport system ATP-binding protein|uniref:ABC transporter ATP-binding protein n=1 Tax=Phytohabitans houttuyneae TaxID=1076126 RepID=A0A6V8KPQ8_9ACTN|nr:ABC transporter ATP-binding protein [Phytohabitans houttuyneae]GFJ83826.1 ABC transporter ATP-binding protein [Phytohabitans houttuyneae]